eukprot:2019912-Pyramimonas_sp.AAC.1
MDISYDGHCMLAGNPLGAPEVPRCSHIYRLRPPVDTIRPPHVELRSDGPQPVAMLWTTKSTSGA